MSTTDVILDAIKVVGPAITGVGGAVATLWKTTHNIFKRLADIEKEVAQLKERVKVLITRISSAEGRNAEAEKRIRTLETGIDELLSSLAKHGADIASVRSSLSSYVQQTAYAKMLERMASLERRVSELDEAQSRHDTTLINFAREQNEQWQGINRSLGQLEGYIRGRESMHDG